MERLTITIPAFAVFDADRTVPPREVQLKISNFGEDVVVVHNCKLKPGEYLTISTEQLQQVSEFFITTMNRFKDEQAH